MAETVNTYQEPKPESQEHVEAMLNKVEESQSAGQERPDWLPEKFKSPEDMAKAYSQLESKMGQQGQEDTDTEEYSGSETPNQVNELLDERGLDFDVFQQEYAELGGLSEEAYEALEQAGFPPEMVDSWIEGQNAVAEKMTTEIKSVVGGEAEYDTLMQWASQNLPEQDIDAYNATMESQNPDMIRLAVQGLHARYRSEGEPSLVQGGTGQVTTGGRFDSTAELTAAMNDPRYDKDPAYRQQVADKLRRSSLF